MVGDPHSNLRSDYKLNRLGVEAFRSQGSTSEQGLTISVSAPIVCEVVRQF